MTEGALVALGESLPPATSQTGWRKVRFGDVVRNVNNNVRELASAGIERVVGLEHLDPQSLHIRRWASSDDGTTFTRLFKLGQVLFGKRRAYQRKVAVAEFAGVCSGDILVFEPANGDLMPELLPFIVQSDGFFEHALGTSAGSLSPRTRWQDLAAYEFNLPPLAEQRRIAQLLWAADEAIEALHNTQESTANVQDAILDKFFSLEWPKARCDDLFLEPPRNGYSPRTMSSSQGLPTLSIGSIRDGRVNTEGNVKYADVRLNEVQGYLLHKGDLLIVRGNGNKTLVARCGLVNHFPENCFYPDLLIRIRFDESRVLPDFVCLQWNWEVVHRVLLAKAKSTNGIWKINGQDIRQHELFVPPVDAQKDLLRQIASVTKSSQAIQHALTAKRQLQTHLNRTLL
jgi:type I restriction enzyme S subunit